MNGITFQENGPDQSLLNPSEVSYVDHFWVSLIARERERERENKAEDIVFMECRLIKVIRLGMTSSLRNI